MDHVKILREYGLFDAKVPRYTSFPPANRFEPDIGHQHHHRWLADLDPKKPVSVYIHIPFCRRLCWFCACRTQGTRTLKPVEDYLTDVVAEIAAVAALIPDGADVTAAFGRRDADAFVRAADARAGERGV